MASVQDESKMNRLEDFIALAKKGKKVRMGIELRKEIMTQRVHPEETSDMEAEMDMYLLIGDYLCEAEAEITGTIPKAYVFGSAGESLTEAAVNRSIGNERLKMDYRRLKDANIVFEEKYF